MVKPTERTPSQKLYLREQIAKRFAVHGFIERPQFVSAEQTFLTRGDANLHVLFYNLVNDSWKLTTPGYKGRYAYKGTGARELEVQLKDFVDRTEV